MNLLMTLSSTPVVSTKTRLHNFCSSFILIKEMFSLAWKTIPLLFEDIKKKTFSNICFNFQSTSDFTINYRFHILSESVEFVVFFGNNICL